MFDTIWNRIVANQGNTFHLVGGKDFSYKIIGKAVSISRARAPIYRSDFERAYHKLPLPGPGEITKAVRGASYVWAILHDPRIAR